MRVGAAGWIALLVGVGVLMLVVSETIAGLGVTGAFGWRVQPVKVEVPSAFRTVDETLARLEGSAAPDGLRDPFVFARPTAVAVTRAAAPAAPRPLPAAEAQPILTAIVWDDDPRALVRWKGREWTIREGGLFDEFQVVRISRDQVQLRREDATLVLTRRNPGE